MLRKWPLLFIIIPIAEIYLLIEVGGHIGALWTVMLVITTAVIGVNLLRYQGIATLARAQQSMSQGVMPAMEMVEGICLAVGGALLITPGFLTDSLGFICLIPTTRRALIRYIMSNVAMKMGGVQSSQGFSASFNANNSAEQSSSEQRGESSGRTFEGEFTRKDK